jgi:hypothetical protein
MRPTRVPPEARRERGDEHALCRPRDVTALLSRRRLSAPAVQPKCVPPAAQALAATGPSIDVMSERAIAAAGASAWLTLTLTPASMGSPRTAGGEAVVTPPPRRRHSDAHAVNAAIGSSGTADDTEHGATTATRTTTPVGRALPPPDRITSTCTGTTSPLAASRRSTRAARRSASSTSASPTARTASGPSRRRH